MNTASLENGFVRSMRRSGRATVVQITCSAAVFLASGACAMSNLDNTSGNTESGASDLVKIVGKLTSEGVECQALRGDDGQLYTLLGDLGTLSVDTRVSVSGEKVEFSTCQQGITIRVRSITPADTDRS